MPVALRNGVRLVLDTNIAVSGMLWTGAPAQIMHFARAGLVELVSTAQLMTEMQDVLPRKKFDKVLARRSMTRSFVFGSYFDLCDIVEPASIPPTVLRDLDDDAVLAAAVAGRAELIVSGDFDLLDIGEFRSIPIVTAAQALERIEGRRLT